jgi:hypothetical protein
VVQARRGLLPRILLMNNCCQLLQVYESIVDHLFPIICSFFLGSWSDTFGRKLLLYIYFVFREITDANMRKIRFYTPPCKVKSFIGIGTLCM